MERRKRNNVTVWNNGTIGVVSVDRKSQRRDNDKEYKLDRKKREIIA